MDSFKGGICRLCQKTWGDHYIDFCDPQRHPARQWTPGIATQNGNEPPCVICRKPRGDHYTDDRATWCDVSRVGTIYTPAVECQCRDCCDQRAKGAKPCVLPGCSSCKANINSGLVGPSPSSPASGRTGGSVERVVNTTDAKVKQAAASCPDAQRVLKQLFPDVFVNPTYDDLGRVNVPTLQDQKGVIYGQGDLVRPIIDVRRAGSHANKAVYLDQGLDWAIERDNSGYAVLVAYRKGSR